MLKVDAHTHVGEGAAAWSGRDVVERMDTMNVDKTVVFPFTEGFFNNDAVVKYVKEYPERLIPFCAVNPWDEKGAADELERCFKNGFKGVKLHPTICGFPLSSKRLADPLFEVVQAYDRVVIVHGSADLYNCPTEFDRMARRFPKVPLIMAHSGYFWEWEQAIEVALENDNLYLETSRIPGFETSKIMEKLGGDKVIWGTDGPFCDYEWEFNKIRRYAKNETEFDKIMGGTILSLIK